MEQRSKWLTMAAVIFQVLYTLSPIDLIPDFIPVLGWADDLAGWGVVATVILGTWLRGRLPKPTSVSLSKDSHVLNYEPLSLEELRRL